MIDIFAVMMHWCASCAGSGNVIPGAAGVVGGAAGALGGLGAAGGGGGAGDADGEDPDLEAALDRLDPPPLVSNVLPYRPTEAPLVEVGGPRTPEDLIEALGAVSGVDGIVTGLQEGLPLAKIVQEYAADKLVEEGLKAGSETAGEKMDEFVEGAPQPDPGPIMGQTGYVANDDGAITTFNPDGTTSTPNADGSVTTTNPDGTSTRTPPTATPRSGPDVSPDGS